MNYWQLAYHYRSFLMKTALVGFVAGFTWTAGIVVSRTAWEELGALVVLGEVYAVQIAHELRP